MDELEHNDNSKFKPHLIIRLIPAAYKRESLPYECIDEKSAIEYSIKQAKHWNRKVCLVWTERVTIWIDEQGQIYGRKIVQSDESCVPAMEVNGQRFLFGA